MLKKSFYVWLDIAIFMFFIIFAEFLIFSDLLFYWGMFFYMKEIFIGFFVLTILVSIYFIGYFFNVHNIQISGMTGYLKLYFSILWRAMIFVIPTVGLIAYIYHGSIGSRIFTIFVEILAGFPAIYWYMLSKYNRNVK